MTYTIRKFSSAPGAPVHGEMISSGVTRDQVIRALAAHALPPLTSPLPRFGRALVVVHARPEKSYCIVHE